MSYYVVMAFIQELKAAAQNIIELSGQLPTRAWSEEASAPTGGFTDRAGFVYYDNIELFADVYAPEDATEGLQRARLARVHKDEAGQELFTIVTLDFATEPEKAKATIQNSDNLTRETLISLLNEPDTRPKYIQVSLDSRKDSEERAIGTRYEYSAESLKELTETDQEELLVTLDKAYNQIVGTL